MRTKEMILDAVRRLLTKKSLKDIRIQDICEECGISKPTFYAYFRDKYDAANAYYFQSILSMGILYNNDCPYEERRLRLLRFFQDNAQVMLQLLYEQGQNSLTDYLLKEVYPMMVPDMERQYQVKFTDNMYYLLRGIWNGQIACLCDWLKDGCRLDAEQLRDILIAMEEGPILQYYKKVK